MLTLVHSAQARRSRSARVDREPVASTTADGAYDQDAVYEALENHTVSRSPRVLIPPKRHAQVKPTVAGLRERNRNIRSRARLGKRRWHTKSGYSR